MFHLAEAVHMRASEIKERPAPAEIGGYALETDKESAASSPRRRHADAGEPAGPGCGIERQSLDAARRGEICVALMDTRLGPSDGALTEAGE